MALTSAFTSHPASVDETYGEHARVASHFAKELFVASLAAAVHAVLPFCFEKTASTKIKCLHQEITSGARCDDADIAVYEAAS